MRVAFPVTSDGGALIDQSYIGFSLGGNDAAGQPHTLSLIRAPGFGAGDPDWGPYLEYDGVESREFDLAACHLDREMLSLDLSRPFGKRPGAPVGFDLSLAALSEERYRELRAWLPVVLRGFEDRLRLAEPGATADRPRD